MTALLYLKRDSGSISSVSLNYFDKLFDVCETNDELAVSSVFVQSRHMAELVASLEASVGVCEIEKQWV